MSTNQLQPPDPVAILCDNNRRPIFSLIFGSQSSPFENKVFSGHEGGWVVQWSLERNRPEKSWQAHSDTVLWVGLEALKELFLLFTQGRDGTAKIWMFQDNEWKEKAEVQCASMLYCNSGLAVNEDKLILAVPSDIQSAIKLYNISSCSDSKLDTSISNSLEPNSTKKYGMCMKINLCRDSVNGLYLVVGYESGSVCIWNVTSRCLLNELTLFEDPVMCLTVWAIKSENDILLKGCCGSTSNQLKLFSFSNSELKLNKTLEVKNKGFSDACVRKDNKILVTGGWDNAGRVFSGKSLKPLAVLTYHQKIIGAVNFSYDNTLAIGCRSGYITLWNVFKS